MDAGGGSEAVAAELVHGNFFTTLGVGAALGRLFGVAEDAAPGASPVVVLSHQFWQRRFDGDPEVVGRALTLNGRPYTVIGVAREGFTGPFFGYAPAMWIPMAEIEPLLGVDLDEWNGSLYVWGRLGDGVSRDAAQAELATLAAQLSARDPSLREPVRFTIDHARGLPAEVRPVAYGAAGMLQATVGLVLLIACANLANLLLARASGRRREVAVRIALGANRRRLVRQLLTESMLLALLGGGLALLLTIWLGGVITRFNPAGLPIALDFSADGQVLLYTLGISLAAGFLFGLMPAIRASAPELVSSLKDHASGYRRSRLRGALIIAQVGLCTFLLAGAALFIRSLGNAGIIDPGFDPKGVVDLTLDLGLRPYGEEQARDYYLRLIEGAEALPGVRSATLARVVPLSGSNLGTSVSPEGAAPDDPPLQIYFNVVAPAYFKTLGISLLRGRDFGAGDAAEAPPAAIINQALAERLWPAGEAIGGTFRVSGDDPALVTVVGVSANAKYITLGEEARPTLYLPLAQNHTAEVTLHVRTAGDPAALRPLLRDAVQSLDPQLALPAVKTMSEDMALSLLPARIGAGVLSLFGALALLLAAVGIAGVVSHAVAERTHEIGVRSALGADRRAVLSLMIGDSMRRVAIGAAVGLALAMLLGWAAAGLLYGVSPLDPAVLLGAPLVLGTVALLAAYLPARRATRVDPMVALRSE